jgi:hypothetical protein
VAQEVWADGRGGCQTPESLGEGTERSEIAGPQVCPEGGAQRQQNTELKKMYAEAMLGIKILQETIEKQL